MRKPGLPVIGLSCELKSPDLRRSFSRQKEILVLNRDYATAIERAGAIPFPLPVVENREVLLDIVSNLDGLIFTGGSDVVSPGEDWRGDIACRKRSVHETNLLQSAQEIGLPILGICRGLQQINVFFGGALWADLPAWKKGAVDHRRSKKERAFRHSVIIQPDSALAAVMGAINLEVNSYHHQAAKTVGPGLKAVAHSSDGVIEALEGSGENLIWAVQWHPERLGEHPAGSRLLEAFISRCMERK